MVKEYVITEKENIVAIADKIRENNELLSIDKIIDKVGSGVGVDDLLSFFNAENYAILESEATSSYGIVYFTNIQPYLNKTIKFALLLSKDYFLGISPIASSVGTETIDIACMINLNGLQNTTMIDSSGVQCVDNEAYLFNNHYNTQWSLRNNISKQEEIYNYELKYSTSGYIVLIFY